MDNLAKSGAVNELPRANGEGPREVVVDPALSLARKVEVMEVLEQDAREMQAASNEGMIGREPDGLREVLIAKRALDAPPLAVAYDVVRRDLTTRLHPGVTLDERAMLETALAALDRVACAMGRPVPKGVPRAGSMAEIDDEIAREKLDP